MASPTEQIIVLRLHLEQMADAIDTALGASEAEDLVRSFRNVGASNQPSNLTRRLSNANELAQGYLAPPEEGDAQVLDR